MKNNKLIVTMIGISTLLFVISIIILLNTDSFSFNKKIDKSENNSNNVFISFTLLKTSKPMWIWLEHSSFTLKLFSFKKLQTYNSYLKDFLL